MNYRSKDESSLDRELTIPTVYTEMTYHGFDPLLPMVYKCFNY